MTKRYWNTTVASPNAKYPKVQVVPSSGVRMRVPFTDVLERRQVRNKDDLIRLLSECK